MTKILIMLISAIGDTLSFTPHLKLIKKKYPKARIDVVIINKGAKEILTNNPNIDNLLFHNYYKKNYLNSIKFLLKLRKEKYDLCIIPYPANKFQYNITAFLSEAKRRLAHKYPIKKFTSFSWLNTKRIPIQKDAHTITQNINLLKKIGIKKSTLLKLHLPLSKKDINFAKKFIKNIKKPIIAFHPGSNTSEGMIIRRWPKENFAKLGNTLSNKYQILLLGTKQEDKLKHDIFNLMQHKPLLVNNTNLKQTTAILKHCKLLITNDTGPMHLAAVVNTPTLVITGPTNPKLTIPLGKIHQTITKNLPCQPCYKVGKNMKCKFKEKDYIKCLKLITPKEVLKKAKEIMKT